MKQPSATLITLCTPFSLTVVINAFSPPFGSANCSAAPNCTVLNREDCAATANTCGKCVSGFVGVTGEANSECFNPAVRRRLHLSTDPTASGGVCRGTLCSTQPKACPGNCSGTGNCIFLDNSGLSLPLCSISNPYCTAKCSCVPGYFGTDCSLDNFTYFSRIKMRNKLCASTNETVGIQDISEDVLVSRANSIASLLLDPTQISLSALLSCTDALLNTISAANDLPGVNICSDQGTDLIMNALSAISAGGNSLPPSLLDRVISTISIISVRRQDYTAVGESTHVLTNNIRMSTTKQSTCDAAKSPFQAPLSALEDVFSVQKSSMQLANSAPNATAGFLQDSTSNTNSDCSATIGVTVVQHTSNIRQESSKIPSMKVQLDGNVNMTGITLVLQNSQPTPYKVLNSATVKSFTCRRLKTGPYNVTVSCIVEEGGNKTEDYKLRCPGDKFGVFKVNLPL